MKENDFTFGFWFCYQNTITKQIPWYILQKQPFFSFVTKTMDFFCSDPPNQKFPQNQIQFHGKTKRVVPKKQTQIGQKTKRKLANKPNSKSEKTKREVAKKPNAKSKKNQTRTRPKTKREP